MNLFFVIHTVIELISAVDVSCAYPMNLTESMKPLKDKLSSTQGLLAELGKLVEEVSGTTIPISLAYQTGKRMGTFRNPRWMRNLLFKGLQDRDHTLPQSF